MITQTNLQTQLPIIGMILWNDNTSDDDMNVIFCINIISYGFGSSEGSVAINWLPTSPHCLISGTSSKWLRIYDLRGIVITTTL